MRRYVAVLTLIGLEDYRRQAGYAAAVDTLDAIAELIPSLVPTRGRARANRRTVEFAFACACADMALTLLLKLRQGIGDHLRDASQPVDCEVAIAAVPYADDHVTEALMLQAERLATGIGPDGSPVLVVEQDVVLADDRQLMRDLRRAMADGTLSLHYQPKLRSRTSELAGAEALLRWHHPELGPLAPDRFIPLAERSDEIRELTHWVIDRALADQQRLREAGVIVPSDVNISAPLVGDPTFAARALEQLGDKAGVIGFEITESAMIADPEGTLANLHRLAGAGIRLAIDDYGTGFSSLAYLQRLPVHELKIDKRFVSALSTSARDPLIVRSTIDLAHALEMEVTAEGIETAAALALLQVMRCDLLQGYFLSPPLPLDEFITFARDSASTAVGRPQVASLRARLAERRAERRQVAS